MLDYGSLRRTGSCLAALCMPCFSFFPGLPPALGISSCSFVNTPAGAFRLHPYTLQEASPWSPLGPKHYSQLVLQFDLRWMDSYKRTARLLRQGILGAWVPKIWSRMRVLGVAKNHNWRRQDSLGKGTRPRIFPGSKTVLSANTTL